MKVRRMILVLTIYSTILVVSATVLLVSEFGIQGREEVYSGIKSRWGASIADFARGKMGDIGAPVCMAAFVVVTSISVNLCRIFIGSRNIIKEIEIIRDVMVHSAKASGICIALELLTMLPTDWSKVDTAHHLALSKGEWSDILAFSVPVLASIVFLIQRLREKDKEFFRLLRTERG